jgi:hypothetical protein
MLGRTFVVAVLVASSALAQQSEKPVDPSSEQVSLVGCLRGRNLVTIDPAERPGESLNVAVDPGRTFRLTGPKDVMKEIEKRNRSAVVLTGLLRKNALDASAPGMPIAGGRIRIGGTPMNQDPTKVDPIDATCPK